jgi:hypothetical protein
LDGHAVLGGRHDAGRQVGALHLDLRTILPSEDGPLRHDQEVAESGRSELHVRREEDIHAVRESDDARLRGTVRLAAHRRRHDVRDAHHVVVLERVIDAVDLAGDNLVLARSVKLREAGEEVRFEEVVPSRGRSDRGDGRRVLAEDGLLDVLVDALSENRRVGLRQIRDGRVERVFVNLDRSVDDGRVDGGDALGVGRERDAGGACSVGGRGDSADVREQDVAATGTEPLLPGVRDEVDYSTNVIGRILDLVGPEVRDEECSCRRSYGSYLNSLLLRYLELGKNSRTSPRVMLPIPLSAGGAGAGAPPPRPEGTVTVALG